MPRGRRSRWIVCSARREVRAVVPEHRRMRADLGEPRRCAGVASGTGRRTASRESRSRSISISGVFRGSAQCVIMLSNAARLLRDDRSTRLRPFVTRTSGPRRSTRSRGRAAAASPFQTHSRLISGSCAKAELDGGGRPQVDRVAEVVPGEAETQADRLVRAVVPGPDGRLAARLARNAPVRPRASTASPPSRASDGMTRPCAVSARSRSARYRFDLPLPFGPVTRFSRSSGMTRSRSER